ncbi:MAG TPA: cytosine permease [Ktedonobacteraceae bacterium]|nr:cytosine permease [Ktedonobacteraceae bacterium]
MVRTTHDSHFQLYLVICSFMGPLAGVMCSDYYLVRKAKLNVGELYNPNGLYRYNRGWNWRAYVAFLFVAMFF